MLEDINNNFKIHYEQRKQVLIKRMQVTIQSFLWCPKGEVILF